MRITQSHLSLIWDDDHIILKILDQTAKIQIFVTSGQGLVNQYSGSVILVSSRTVNRLTDVNIN